MTEKKKILVAEDALELHRLLRHVLEGAGHEVHIVTNGVEALDALRTQKFDVLVTDVDMPRMDGFQLVDSLTSVDYDGAVVMMTGLLDAERIRQLEALVTAKRVQSFLDKPFTPAELLEAVARALGFIADRDRIDARRDGSNTDDNS